MPQKAVFLGRFQPMHKGHYLVINQYRVDYDLTVVVGSSEKSRTPRNPLTFEERKRIIKACFPDIDILPLRDEDRGEEGYPAWTRRLLDKTGADVIITRNDLVKQLVEKYGDADIVQQELYRPETCSGAEIRRRMRNTHDWRPLVPDCAEEEIENVKHHIIQAEGGV